MRYIVALDKGTLQHCTLLHSIDTRVLELERYEEAEELTVWKLANVRINRKGAWVVRDFVYTCVAQRARARS